MSRSHPAEILAAAARLAGVERAAYFATPGASAAGWRGGRAWDGERGERGHQDLPRRVKVRREDGGESSVASSPTSRPPMSR